MSEQLVLTGAGGFLGWHVRVLTRALGWPDPIRVTRADLADPAKVAAKLDGADRLLHLAGVNRGNPDQVATGNVGLALALAQGLRRCAVPPKRLVFANSVQAGNGTAYGDSKAAAAGILGAATGSGSIFVDLRLPHLYGEHGRPFYNSVVATFCHALAEGGEPEVRDDRTLDLVHASDAAARLIDAHPGGPWDTTMPATRISVRQLATTLCRFAADYRAGEIPALADRFHVRLFNTYRSHLFPGHCPLPLARHGDARGDLVEMARTHGGGGQTFCSTSRPGVTRGEHFHLAKVERFAVLRGAAEISLRRIGGADVVRYPVTGEAKVAVDMPTMWVHNITNTGPSELLTLFWTNEIFDPVNSDTYPESVGPVEASVEGGSEPVVAA